jgi:nucleoid-associated protein YgaU
MAAVVSLAPYPSPRARAAAVPPAGARRPAPTRAPRSHRRAAVYFRRRVVAAALAVGVVLAAAQAGAALGGSSLATAERRPQVVSVVVEPGDTLWSVARRVAPDADPRPVVDALVAARGTTALVPGETITWLQSE